MKEKFWFHLGSINWRLEVWVVHDQYVDKISILKLQNVEAAKGSESCKLAPRLYYNVIR